MEHSKIKLLGGHLTETDIATINEALAEAGEAGKKAGIREVIERLEPIIDSLRDDWWDPKARICTAQDIIAEYRKRLSEVTDSPS